MKSRWWSAPISALLLLLFVPGSASAHAKLVRAEPAPSSVSARAPGEVDLWFDESVDPQFSEVRVLDASGARVDAGEPVTGGEGPLMLSVKLKPLADGSYSVLWKAFSATDGHITRGIYVFAVGQTAAAPVAAPGTLDGGSSQATPLTIIVRAASLIGLLVLVGGIFFRLFLLDRSLRQVAIDPALVEARWLSLEGFALSLALVGNIAELLLEVMIVTDRVSIQAAAEVLFGTRWGGLWLVRFLALIVMGTILFAKSPRVRILIPSVSLVTVVSLYLMANLTGLERGLSPAGQSAPQGLSLSQQTYLYVHHLGLLLPFVFFFAIAFYQKFRLRGLLMPIGLAALLTVALSGHGAAAQGDLSIALASDWLHQAAAAVWAGGLVHLTWMMPLLRRALGPQPHRRFVGWLLPQFSGVAIASTVVLFLTGIYNSLVEVPALASLAQFRIPSFGSDSEYAYALMAKVALFGVMLSLGAVNLLWLSPRLRRYLLAPQKGDRPVVHQNETLARRFGRSTPGQAAGSLLGKRPTHSAQSSDASPQLDHVHRWHSHLGCAIGALVTCLRVTVGAEMTLGLAAIVLAGILSLQPPARTGLLLPGNTTPPNSSVARQVLDGQAAPDVRVRLTVSQTGSDLTDAPDSFDARLTDANDRPVANVLRVYISFAFQDSDTGVQRIEAEPRADGHYVVSGNYLPQKGNWRIRVIVRRGGVEDVSADFTLKVDTTSG